MNDKRQTNPQRQRKWPQKLSLTVIILVIAAGGVVTGSIYGRQIKSGFNKIMVRVGLQQPPEAAETGDQEQLQYYTCGMHPWVVLPEPGNCPICQMKLTPLDPEKFTGRIDIDPVVVQNMGVRVEPVTKGPLTKKIRTVGSVDYNETTVRDINIKVSGWIEKLNVDYIGAPVEAGEALFELYSPQLYAAQEEYLLAWRNRRSREKDTRQEGQMDLLKAARTRLEYFDITDEQIKALREAGKPSKTIAIHSPYKGVVINKHAREGMKVDPGMRVFQIADLSTVWVMVTLYEYQLPYVSQGQKAVMSLPYLPGNQFEGKVVYIYPYLDNKTREVQVRLEFQNPGGLLKPGMFAEVMLESTLAKRRTLVPRSAVIDTGERQVAFVWKGRGRFEPRDVKLGVEVGENMLQVIDGLKPGEQVVTSGQFLIDSEAKLREALAKMIGEDLAYKKTVSAEVADKGETAGLPTQAKELLSKILDRYFEIQTALAKDSTESIPEKADKLAESMAALIEQDIPTDEDFWSRHTEAATAREAALKLAEVKKLDEARLNFADLSTSLVKLLKTTGVPAGIGEVNVLHCPMYRQGQGGTVWMQPVGDVRNPYYGSRMLQCYDERYALPAADGAETRPATAPGEAIR